MSASKQDVYSGRRRCRIIQAGSFHDARQIGDDPNHSRQRLRKLRAAPHGERQAARDTVHKQNQRLQPFTNRHALS